MTLEQRDRFRLIAAAVLLVTIGLVTLVRVRLCPLAEKLMRTQVDNQASTVVYESIQEQLHIVCVLFTEEVGGIITFVFDEDGTLQIETTAAEEDILYDEIGSGMLVRQIQNNRREMLNSLELFYKVFILHHDPGDLLEED